VFRAQEKRKRLTAPARGFTFVDRAKVRQPEQRRASLRTASWPILGTIAGRSGEVSPRVPFRASRLPGLAFLRHPSEVGMRSSSGLGWRADRAAGFKNSATHCVSERYRRASSPTSSMHSVFWGHEFNRGAARAVFGCAAARAIPRACVGRDGARHTHPPRGAARVLSIPATSSRQL